MVEVNLATAKVHLGRLVDRAAAGEAVVITRGGKPVVRLTAAAAPRERIDANELQAVTETLPALPESATDLVRSMRDGDRH